MNSASVDEPATVGWNLDLYAIVPAGEPYNATSERTTCFDACSPIRIGVCVCNGGVVFWTVVEEEVVFATVDRGVGALLKLGARGGSPEVESVILCAV